MLDTYNKFYMHSVFSSSFENPCIFICQGNYQLVAVTNIISATVGLLLWFFFGFDKESVAFTLKVWIMYWTLYLYDGLISFIICFLLSFLPGALASEDKVRVTPSLRSRRGNILHNTSEKSFWDGHTKAF